MIMKYTMVSDSNIIFIMQYHLLIYTVINIDIYRTKKQNETI